MPRKPGLKRKLLTPDPAAIGRPAGPAQPDAIGPAHLTGTRAQLTADLVALVGQGKVLHRVSDLVRYASDASPYRLLPQAVVLPRHVQDLVAVLGYCRRTGRHATFRAAGTSLNGQAQSDDIPIDVRRHWGGMVVEDDAAPAAEALTGRLEQVKAGSAPSRPPAGRTGSR